MKIAVFGGSGRTGRHLVEQALAAGHEVVALVRNPARLDVSHQRLTCVQGDILNAAQVRQTISGSDAVVSVLGPTRNEPVYEVSQGMEHILDAMAQAGVRRLIISAGAGIGYHKDTPGLFHRFISLMIKLFGRYVYADMKRVIAIVAQSNLDWTIVRVPMLTDDPPTGQVRVGYVGQGTGHRLTRADMAEFMLRQLADGRYRHDAPAISNYLNLAQINDSSITSQKRGKRMDKSSR
jgi:putative NADH-flavin reductase